MAMNLRFDLENAYRELMRIESRLRELASELSEKRARNQGFFYSIPRDEKRKLKTMLRKLTRLAREIREYEYELRALPPEKEWIVRELYMELSNEIDDIATAIDLLIRYSPKPQVEVGEKPAWRGLSRYEPLHSYLDNEIKKLEHIRNTLKRILAQR